jgi:hypothetical protein
VALQLADYRRHGEAREGVPARRVVAVDRLDEPHARDLEQVLERLAAALVAAGQLPRQRQVAPDQRLARTRIAVSARPVALGSVGLHHRPPSEPRCARLLNSHRRSDE